MTKLQDPITAQTETSIITKLAQNSRLEYDRVRKETAKQLGVQVKTLDDAVRTERAKVRAKDVPMLFEEVEPWHAPIIVDELLNELVDIFKRFAILPEYSDIALALWVCFTWCIEAANTAPILALNSPEKRCGKTTVLSLLNILVKRPLSTSNITPSALFRAIEEYKPTLLIDEANTFLKHSDDLRGILNSGHTRSTAFVLRTVGDDHMPKAFNTWGAKTIALIGKLPDTLHDRSIVIPLKRKLSHEKTERLHRSNYDFESVKRKLARFAAEYTNTLKRTIPKALTCISDRAEDNWESLLAIATIAGSGWEAKTLRAIMALTDRASEPQTYGVSLLADIKEIFAVRAIDKMFSGELIDTLCHEKEKPWATFRHGSPIDQRMLASLLKEFAIVSKTLRIGHQILKGYELVQFEDAFARYTSISPTLSVTALQPAETAEYGHISLPLQNILNNLSVTTEPAGRASRNAVTAKTSKNDQLDEYLLEERAGILEYDSGMSREEAEMAVWGKTRQCLTVLTNKHDYNRNA